MDGDAAAHASSAAEKEGTRCASEGGTGAEAKQLPVDHTARLYGLENGEHTVIEPLTPVEPMEARTLRDDDDDIEASRSRVAVQDY